MKTKKVQQEGREGGKDRKYFFPCVLLFCLLHLCSSFSTRSTTSTPLASSSLCTSFLSPSSLLHLFFSSSFFLLLLLLELFLPLLLLLPLLFHPLLLFLLCFFFVFSLFSLTVAIEPGVVGDVHAQTVHSVETGAGALANAHGRLGARHQLGRTLPHDLQCTMCEAPLHKNR